MLSVSEVVFIDFKNVFFGLCFSPCQVQLPIPSLGINIEYGYVGQNGVSVHLNPRASETLYEIFN